MSAHLKFRTYLTLKGRNPGAKTFISLDPRRGYDKKYSGILLFEALLPKWYRFDGFEEAKPSRA